MRFEIVESEEYEASTTLVKFEDKELCDLLMDFYSKKELQFKTIELYENTYDTKLLKEIKSKL